jgi:DNA-binding NtrC family response regulator
MTLGIKQQTTSRAKILIVDDDREMCQLLADLLGEEGYAVEVVHDGSSALARYRVETFDLTITDLMMPRMRGTELVKQLREIDAHALVLLITGFGSIESAVEAMRAGAYHYITKPFRTDEILLQVTRALEQRSLRSEVERLRKEVQERHRFENIIGRSKRMREIFDIVAHVSDLAVNVLIVGESGTGKEMIARAIHHQSARVEKAFIPLNCAAIPETLLESELFGYVRGAFTDARKDRRGLFQAANGGTLFLDEISEIPLGLQAKLLRVIEDKEVRPLGANYAEKVDTRLLSACNRDPERLVQEGQFRQDLYYRLNVIRIDLPPLRERVEDIPILVDHFIQKFASQAQRPLEGIEPEALDTLINYRWPGNVRELEHTIERAIHLGKENRIGLQDFPPALLARSDNVFPLSEAVGKSYTLKDLEKEYIMRVMEIAHGNKTEAAKTLGVDRTTLYRKLDEYKVKG